MKFIDRRAELAYLDEAKLLSASKLFSVSVSGLRRVGKTRLILEFMKNTGGGIYFFVNKEKTSESLLKEYEESVKASGLLTEMESLKGWDDFFKVLFERYKGVVVFDEFQNFIYLEKRVCGILQKYMDLNENHVGPLFIFSGSTLGLIKKLFSDAKEPLYGRIKRQLRLKPLALSDVVSMCGELGITDTSEIVGLYSVFGGFPRYYVAIEDEGLKGKTFGEILDRFFFMENAIFENEVATILSLEFGKRSGKYYDILAAIASGCTRMSEVASFLGKKETAITRQVNELVHHFEIVGVERQAVGNKKLLFINHPLINFWFRFFYKNLSDYGRRAPEFIEKVKKETNGYVGRRFEQVCRELLTSGRIVLPFKFETIGRDWGKMPDRPKGENQYEIDIVALKTRTKEILFCECKWQENVDATAIFGELGEKARCVQWNQGGRKEYYAIFAKSFRQKKMTLPKNLLLFDLDDLKKSVLPKQ